MTVRFISFDSPLDRRAAGRLITLLNRCWPDSGSSHAARVEKYLGSRKTKLKDYSKHAGFFSIETQGRFVAHAGIFPRTIKYDGGSMIVMALAGVCVEPAFRRRGLGRMVVEAAFEKVKDGRYPLSLFQTIHKYSDFYSRFGCVPVNNRFVDSSSSQTDANPWWNEVVMIYTASHDWPDGTVDLCGPGY